MTINIEICVVFETRWGKKCLIIKSYTFWKFRTFKFSCTHKISCTNKKCSVSAVPS